MIDRSMSKSYLSFPIYCFVFWMSLSKVILVVTFWSHPQNISEPHEKTISNCCLNWLGFFFDMLTLIRNSPTEISIVKFFELFEIWFYNLQVFLSLQQYRLNDIGVKIELGFLCCRPMIALLILDKQRHSRIF